MEGEECKIKPDPILRVSRSVQAKDCKGMDEKECKNNPDICTYRSFKGGKRGCAAKRGTLKPGVSTTKQHPLPYASRDLLEEFKPTVLEYLPDLIGTTSDGGTHLLPHNHTLFIYYHHIEVVKRFTITEDTKFTKSLRTIVGGPVSLIGNMVGKMSLGLFNSPVSEWDTSQVTGMKSMFSEAESFNQPIDEWNVSGVSTMAYMFHGATVFNQPLEGWNITKVTNMNHIFWDAKAFNQPLEGWDMTSVLVASYMFENATQFNQPLGQWDTGNISDMKGMFTGASTFNQPLKGWDTSNVTNMAYMFARALAFNQSLEGWNKSNTTSMFSMFEVSGMTQIPSWYKR
jgi:surface protein